MKSKAEGWSRSRPRSLAAVFGLHLGLAFIGPDCLARFGGLFTCGSDLVGIGPFLAVNCPVQGFARPGLATGPFGKVSHPIEPIREIEQFLSGFRDGCLPR